MPLKKTRGRHISKDGKVSQPKSIYIIHGVKFLASSYEVAAMQYIQFNAKFPA